MREINPETDLAADETPFARQLKQSLCPVLVSTAGHSTVGDDMLNCGLYAKQYAGKVSDPAKTIVLFAGWQNALDPFGSKKSVSAAILKEVDGMEEMMLLLSLCMIVVLLAS